MLSEAVLRLIDASLKVLIAVAEAQDHKVLSRWTPQMTESALKRISKDMAQQELSVEQLSSLRQKHMQDSLKTMARVFNPRTD